MLKCFICTLYVYLFMRIKMMMIIIIEGAFNDRQKTRYIRDQYVTDMLLKV